MNSYVFIVLVKDNLSSESQCYCKSHHSFPIDSTPSIFPSNFMSFPAASVTEGLPRAPGPDKVVYDLEKMVSKFTGNLFSKSRG